MAITLAERPVFVVGQERSGTTLLMVMPAVQARFAGEGLEPFPSSPDEAARYVQADIPRWAEAVRLSGAKAD